MLCEPALSADVSLKVAPDNEYACVMVRRYVASFFLGILLMLTSDDAAAQSPAMSEERSPGAIVTGAWSDPAICNMQTAVRVNFGEVLERASELNGKCIAVEGFWAGRALFGRVRDGNKPGSNIDEVLHRKRIGIYARNDILDAAPERSTRYVMVGVLGQCETEWPDAIMVLGYCHYVSGLILKISEVIRAE